jgi:hypothetical protein
MRAFAFLRRLVGLLPTPPPQSGNRVEPSKPWPRSPDQSGFSSDFLDKVPTEAPPTYEEIDTQMKFSAAMSRCLDSGMTYEQAKDYIEACADDIKAGIQTPWRKKIGENRYQADCGCIFNSDRARVSQCRDHR